MRFVVMGATGMIGQALIREIIKDGGEVLAIDRPCEKLKSIPQHPNVKILECDIAELNSVDAQGAYDVFFHLGWKSTSTHSRDDVFAQEENIRFTLDAVKLAKRLGCGTFVGAGSQAEYGRVEGLVSPHSPINPENGYGIAKYAAGRLSRILCEQLELRHNWARILSVYGPGDNPYTMIMYCVRELLEGRSPQVTKCEQMWDYLYCDDVARALLAIGKNGKDASVYCIGSGRERLMKEYIQSIGERIDARIEIGYGKREYNPNQVMHLCADVSNLKADTGFEPQVSFEEGIENTIKWCKEELGL